MDKIFKTEKFDVDPNASDVEMRWCHWYRTFSNYLTIIEELHVDKLATHINHVSPSVCTLFSECNTYEDAIDVLRMLYVKRKNEVYTRHLLTIRRQEAGETIDQ